MPGVGVVTVELLGVSAVLAVPAAGGLLFAARLGVRSRPVLCIFALAAPCLIGYAAIALYLASSTFGRFATLGLYLAAALVTISLARSAGTSVRRSLRFWAGLAGLTVAAAAFSIGMGFLRGGCRASAESSPRPRSVTPLSCLTTPSSPTSSPCSS